MKIINADQMVLVSEVHEPRAAALRKYLEANHPELLDTEGDLVFFDEDTETVLDILAETLTEGKI